MKHSSTILGRAAGTLASVVLTVGGSRADETTPALPIPECVYRELSYKKVDGTRELKLFMIAPFDWKSSDGRPALLYFHGGGWIGGAPKPRDRKLASLAARGMVCFAVEYRLLARESNDPPIIPIQDAQSAIRWVRGHATELGVDPNRVAAGGGSAGGYLAAFLGLMKGFDDPQDDTTIPTRPQALVLLSPALENGPTGFGYERVGNRYKEFSPFYHVASGAPPAIILVGDQDKIVPEKMIKEFQAAMESAGTRCELHLYPGVGHSAFLNDASKAFPKIEKFLESLGWMADSKTQKHR